MGCSASRSDITFLANNNLQNEPSPFEFDTKFNQHSPIRRALTFVAPLVHHLPMRKGDSHHLVTLTSSTYGSLRITREINSLDSPDHVKIEEIEDERDDSLTPDLVINTWELMDGLDDDDDDNFVTDSGPGELNSTANDIGKKLDDDDSYEFVRVEDANVDIDSISISKKPFWQHLSEESVSSKLDRNAISSFRQQLNTNDHNHIDTGNHNNDIESNLPLNSSKLIKLKGTEDRIVIYFTSLRGIRKTYEDCCLVRTIFRGYRVDERDVSMDSNYRKELENVMVVNKSLPQVFIGGNYIGGIEEIKQMNENGDLGKLLLLKGFQIYGNGFCESCGDARFVPCGHCDGSRKLFEEEEQGFKRCHVCNENGLVHCPTCCY